MGIKGEHGADGTLKFTVPKNATSVLDGVRLAPGSDMIHEVEMMEAGNETIMMGELVLREQEVAAATKEVQNAGLQETALHNHMLRERPHVVYLHFHEHGDGVQMAKAIRSIIVAHGGDLNAVKDEHVSGIDTAGLDRIMGLKGEAGNGVYDYSIPRNDTITMNGVTLPPGMDVSTGISFQPLEGGRAAMVGEWVLTADEVVPVTKALTRNNIEVTAIHSHMLTEEPRLSYLHCWAKGNATDIARGVRETLGLTNSKR